MLKVELKKTVDNSYPIEIGSQILGKASTYIEKATRARKLLIITNETVYKLYYQKLVASLKHFEIEKIILKDGEKHKNIGSLQKIWDKALKFKLERKDAIIALGGGVIGDTAGFAAATYLRGIDFIQIPTTLLAQVDSSIGGKVAINHPLGKNMLGAFYQPKLVLIDTSTLKTLPEKELKTGLGEVLKYAFIEKSCELGENLNLFEFLKANKAAIYNFDSIILEKLVEYCCKLKASVVSKDEKESGLRAILNLGHTIGHAIEKTTDYKKFTHGEAISLGMIGAFKLALDKNLIDANYMQEALELLIQYEIIRKPGIDAKKVAKATAYDKKVVNSKVRFILPTAQGEVAIFDDIKEKEIIKAVEYIKKAF
ncbi:MAG: 3-dehydroquinate synthase [bacterium]